MGYAFISYSSKNRNFADKLTRLFDKNSIESWVAPDDIPAGSKYAQVINKAIKNCACFVLLLSSDSMNSVWVAKEVERAINYKKLIIPVKIEELTLTDEFELYISTDQMISVYDIEKTDDEVQSLLSIVKAHIASNPYEKKTLEQELLGNAKAGAYTPPAAQNQSSSVEIIHKPKGKAISKSTMIICICSAVVVLGLVFALMIISLGNQNNHKDPQENYPNVSNSVTDVPKETDNNAVSPTEHKTAPPTQAQAEKNQIPKKYENTVTALKHANDLALRNSTLRVKVGEYATPPAAMVWTDAKIYSENTDIAVGEGVLVKGVSKGETYILLESKVGSTCAYYVIVE